MSGRRRKKGGKTKSASYDEPEPKAFRDVVETVDGRGNVLTFQFDDNEQEDEDNFINVHKQNISRTELRYKYQFKINKIAIGK